MAYTPKTWNCGDTITAEDLNHIEQGIANSGGGTALVVNSVFDEDGIFLDKTWQEIYDAMPSVIIQTNGRETQLKTLVSSVGFYAPEGEEAAYSVYSVLGRDGNKYVTTTASGYPRINIDKPTDPQPN